MTESPRDQLIRQLLISCVHFTGIGKPACAAGVDYMTVRDASEPGPYRWPCLNFPNRVATTTCEKRCMYTAETATAEADRIRELEAKAFGAELKGG